ncbi:MAG: ribokinase [Rhizobiaceae bacterium]|nr:ribokinase [Rhizobiaceae bacterium]
MIFNFGSINIDHVYRVASLPKPGETLSAISYDRYLGGKGINQSIAISKAGGNVCHVGAVGGDGDWALDQIERLGVGITQIVQVDAPTGNAIINVDDAGENEIVILSGANACLSADQVSRVLEQASGDDWVLVQNETNLVPDIVLEAKRRELRVVYSAAPFVADVTVSLLDKVDLLVVNEGEADALALALDAEVGSIPVPEVLITKGSTGSRLQTTSKVFDQTAFGVEAVDTTGAGDTFLGSYLARIDLGETQEAALRYASAASALQVTKPGAATAIPEEADVLRFIETMERN